MLLVLAACGSDDPTPTTAAADPTATPEPAKELITFTDLNWNSGHIQTAIASYIVNKGYGYPVDAVTLDTLPGFNALEKGDTQVSMEIWLPNQQEAWDNAVAAGTVIGVGHSLDDNWQSSFVIPGYTQDANPGLQTVEDLKKPEYKALFTTIESGGKASGLGCIPGWACEVVNEEKIPGYDLEDHVEIANPGSVGALDAAIRGAFEKKEDLLFYYWGPTQISAELDLRILEEPPHNDACFEVRACAYPVAEVIVAVHSSLVERAPEVVAFLEKYNFTAAAQVAAETYLSETGAEFDEVAKWWLTNQEEFWIPFVTDEAATKIRAALAS
jgi:glycine betaine/proline transport system substrate-binding protein